MNSMKNMDSRVVAVGIFAIIAVLAALLGQQLRSDPDTPQANPDTNAPTATLPDASVAPSETPGVTETPSSVSSAVEKLQTKAAADFVTSYFAYSFRDTKTNAFMGRTATYMTPSGYKKMVKSYVGDDGGMTVEWNNIRKEQRVVTANVVSSKFDPLYTPQIAKAIVAVTFTQSTANNAGTGGTGAEQLKRVLVVKSGNKYLVQDFFYLGDGT